MNRAYLAYLIALGLSLSCTPEVGLQGSTGPAGPAGSPGAMPGLSPDCPDGYTRDTNLMTIVLCKRGSDEVVKVGRKGTAFWIDRYESGVWSNEDGTGTQYGIAPSYNYPISFPGNGQSTTSLYAVSQPGVMPSVNLTWFQSNEACRAAGKRLPSTDEWFAAVRGTIDPAVDNNGATGDCVTKGSVRMTGGGSSCVSVWGAQDMVGNVEEPTQEWQVGAGSGTETGTPWPTSPAPNGYGGDGVYNVISSAYVGATATKFMPSIVIRGGEHTYGVRSGIFSTDLSSSPVQIDVRRGFRCVIPR